MAGVDEIIFACRQLNYDPHWYANFGYYAENADRKAYRAMGRLCKLNLRTAQVTVLLDAPQGTVRDPQVHYDGRKILFSYRKGGTENFHLYEINADGSGMIGGYAENKQDQSDRQWPSTIAAAEAIQRRCVHCHNKSLPLPRALSDGHLRHRAFNLTRPEKSLVLLAPLSSEASGYGICKRRGKDGEPDETVTIFADANDPDYQKILALCSAGKKHLEHIKRFDMPGFRPLPSYVREMKRYGILPKDLAADADIDVYATDRAYWRSLWHKPRLGSAPPRQADANISAGR